MSSRLGHVIDLLSEDGNSLEFFVGGRRESEITINSLHNLNDVIRQRNMKRWQRKQNE